VGNLSGRRREKLPIKPDKVIHITAYSAPRLLFWSRIVVFQSGFRLQGALP
jgi:hypothetical protein